MGAALYIVLNSQEPGFDYFVSGKALSANEAILATIAQKLGLTPLMGFFSISENDLAEAAEDFGLEDVDLAGVEGPGQWFHPDEGLRTVRGLRQYLEKDRTAVKNNDAVIADLEEFARVLEEARRRDLRWHLAVDY